MEPPDAADAPEEAPLELHRPEGGLARRDSESSPRLRHLEGQDDVTREPRETTPFYRSLARSPIGGRWWEESVLVGEVGSPPLSGVQGASPEEFGSGRGSVWWETLGSPRVVGPGFWLDPSREGPRPAVRRTMVAGVGWSSRRVCPHTPFSDGDTSLALQSGTQRPRGSHFSSLDRRVLSDLRPRPGP